MIKVEWLGKQDRCEIPAEGIDISKLGTGIYNVNLILVDGTVSISKVVVVNPR